MPALRHTRCELWYKTAASDEWIRLASPTNDAKHNVKSVRFGDGIIITQVGQYNNACTVHVSIDGVPLVELSGDSLTPSTTIDVDFVCSQVFDATYDSVPAHLVATTRMLPLATISKDFSAIRLTKMVRKEVKGTVTRIRGREQPSVRVVIREHLETLLMNPALGQANHDAGAS